MSLDSADMNGHAVGAIGHADDELLDGEDADLRDILQVMHECQEEQMQLDEQWQRLRTEKQQTITVDSMDHLYNVRYNLQHVMDESQELSDLIAETNDLAEGVSQRVRQLDQCQDRVRRVVDVVESFIDLKRCVREAEDALARQQFERATEFVSKVQRQQRALVARERNLVQNGVEEENALEEEALEQSNAAEYAAQLQEATYRMMEQQAPYNNDFAKFRDVERRVKEVVKRKFQESIEKGEIDDIRRFAKMFAPLGLEQDGLWVYVQFLAAETRRDLDVLLEKTLPSLAQSDPSGTSNLPRPRITFVDLITEVLDIVAACIEQQENFLLTEFSTGNLTDNLRVMSLMVKEMQSVCGDACGKVLDTYARVRSLNILVEKIQKHKFQNEHMKEDENDPLDPRNLDLLLEEMAIICARCQMYDRFVTGKLEGSSGPKEERNNHNVKEHSSEQHIKPNMPQSTLISKLNELMMHYIPIDDHFMRRSIQKAAKLNKYKSILRHEERSLFVSSDSNIEDNEDVFMHTNDYDGLGSATLVTRQNREEHEDLVDSDSSDEDSDDYESDSNADDEDKCTTLVDDTFFILQKAISRLLRTLNVQVICAVLNNINTILTDMFKRELTKHLQLISAHRNVEYKARKFLKIISSLNNLDMSSIYTTKLKNEFEHSCEDVIRNGADRAKLQFCVQEMEQVADEFKKILQERLKKFFLSTLEDRITVLAQKFGSVNYDLTEMEYNQNEVQDPFAEHFIEKCGEYLETYERFMTTNNFEFVVQHCVALITQTFESVLFDRPTNRDEMAVSAINGKTRHQRTMSSTSSTSSHDAATPGRTTSFSQLGGLQFDKDIRKLLLYLSSKSQTTVRDKFSRLTQMASLVKMNRVYEVLEYWGENAVMTWRLTPAEVRQVLQFRRDFKTEAINRLKL